MGIGDDPDRIVNAVGAGCRTGRIVENNEGMFPK
jgi:hypothetical protein